VEVEMALNIIVRPGQSRECKTILKIWTEAEATPSVTDSLQNLKQVLKDSGDLFLVAEYKGKIIGTVIGGWDGWRGNIYRLAVLPNYRRQGIGRALVQELERRLASKGARKISVLIEHEDDLAVSFWNALDNMGYKRDPRIIRYAKSL